MEKLKVQNIPSLNKESSLQEISAIMDKLQKNTLQHAPWPTFPYKPSVSFAIAHHNDCIYLKYFVREKAIRVTCQQANDPVHKDSCVEFFLLFDGENEYYNFEFNCLGTCMIGFGKDRNERRLIAEEIMSKIRYQSIVKSASDSEEISWELTLMIPLEIFIYHTLSSLKDKQCRANFYKCGDELPEPHFLAWKNVVATLPDFHLPEFFGSIEFL